MNNKVNLLACDHEHQTAARIVREMDATFAVTVVYPGPQFDSLDELLERLAAGYGGRWFGSGVEFVTQWLERDIEFHFTAEAEAREFAAKCTCIIGVRVTEIHHPEICTNLPATVATAVA